MQISIKATEPQAAFLGMHCKFPAFVAGFGTGKSEVMCNSALLDSLEGGASSMIAMYEPTYDLVRLILAPRLLHDDKPRAQRRVQQSDGIRHDVGHDFRAL